MTCTLKDIAAAAQVSEATVSYVLNGNGRVSDKTAAKVHLIADQLGYKMNPLVSQLMKGVRTAGKVELRAIFGFLHFMESDSSILTNNDFIGRVFRGAKSQSELLGVVVDPISIKSNRSLSRVSQILDIRGISGVFLGSLDRLDRPIDIDISRIGMVSIGYSSRSQPVHRIAPNNFDGMRVAAERLIKRGFRRIGIAFHNDEIDFRSNYGFTTALRLVCEHNNIAVVPAFNHATEYNKNALKWASENELEVVFTTKSEAFQKLSSKCLIISLTDEATGNGASLTQAPEKIGAFAFDELFGIIARNETGHPRAPKLVLTPLELKGI